MWRVTANGLGGRPMWMDGKNWTASKNLGSRFRRGVDTKGETWLLGWGLRGSWGGDVEWTVATTTAGKCGVVWCVVESLFVSVDCRRCRRVEKDQQCLM